MYLTKNGLVASLIVCAALASHLQAQAQAQEFQVFPSVAEYRQVMQQGQRFAGVTIDNDSLLMKRQDAWYTSGNQVSVYAVKHEDAKDSGLNPLAVETVYGWHIGQDLYTASDIKVPAKQLSAIDHPYAGWLYAGLYREQSVSDAMQTKVTLDLGCFGPCAGGAWTQNHLHRLLRQPLPQGWDSQLKQEWGVIAGAEWSPAQFSLHENLALRPRLKMRLGNILTDASGELTLRMGQLNHLPHQPLQALQARAELRWVAYDASIQGAYFADQSLLVKPRRWVGEFEIAYLYQSGNYHASLAIVQRNSVIEQISNSLGSQKFVRLQVNRAL